MKANTPRRGQSHAFENQHRRKNTDTHNEVKRKRKPTYFSVSSVQTITRLMNQNVEK